MPMLSGEDWDKRHECRGHAAPPPRGHPGKLGEEESLAEFSRSMGEKEGVLNRGDHQRVTARCCDGCCVFRVIQWLGSPGV